MPRTETSRSALLLAASLLLFGCDGSLLQDDSRGPLFFSLNGELDPDVSAADPNLLGAVVWFWEAADDEGAMLELPPFSAQAPGWSMDIHAPPGPDEADLAAEGVEIPLLHGAPGLSLLVGLPVLLGAEHDDPELRIRLDAAALLDWLTDPDTDARLLIATPPGAEAGLRAVARDHLLIALAAEDELERLGERNELSPEIRAQLGEIVPGLTVYRRPEVAEGWTPLAAPGEQAEFSGIDLRRPESPTGS